MQTVKFKGQLMESLIFRHSFEWLQILVGEAVGGWRPCNAGLLLGLLFYGGLGAIHISLDCNFRFKIYLVGKV